MSSGATNTPDSAKRREPLLSLSAAEAREFLLKQEHYCSLDLPQYVTFADVLAQVDSAIAANPSASANGRPRDVDGVCHTILHNKDGRYAWRPFQLIHPALYVSLVRQLTDLAIWQALKEWFRRLSQLPRVTCLSLPVISRSDQSDKAEQVSEWWDRVEQQSVELSLEYDHLIQTDITDCYGSIYTHSIAWALHTRPVAKARRWDKSLIGNVIDSAIQDMRNGQTNGIPQGSTLMDLIAEMVLGHADLLICQLLDSRRVVAYRILRYRDDYRVFVNDTGVGDAVVKAIMEVCTDLGMRLNAVKTRVSADVVSAAIKSDKLSWLSRRQADPNLQKHLLMLYSFGLEHTNAGRLVAALDDFAKRLDRRFSLKGRIGPLVAVATALACRHPRTFPVCAVVLSKLLALEPDEETRKRLLVLAYNKIRRLPNNGYLEIWLQRVTWPLERSFAYAEPLCSVVAGTRSSVWNSSWVTDASVRQLVDGASVVDVGARDALRPVMGPEEVALFVAKFASGYY